MLPYITAHIIHFDMGSKQPVGLEAPTGCCV